MDLSSVPTVDRTFLIARNPDPDSTLPYLLRLPVPPAGLVLRARDTWPRTAKIYCYRGEDLWSEELEIVQKVDERAAPVGG